MPIPESQLETWAHFAIGSRWQSPHVGSVRSSSPDSASWDPQPSWSRIREAPLKAWRV